MNTLAGSEGSYAVRKAQLQSTLSNVGVTLTANCFIAASAASLIYMEAGGRLIFMWLASILVLNMLRLAYGVWQRKRIHETSHPGSVLKTLAVLALIAGIAWVPLPLYFCAAVTKPTAAYIVFILCGITTGSIVQSLAYWRLSIAFSAPILLATLVTLIREGDAIAFLVATNVLLLMGMLFRIAVISEANFRQNHATRLQATELAASLQHAHNELQTANQTLKRLATTDTLTGLPNRSIFNQTLAGFVHDHEPVALALVDVDEFKIVNDNHGHAAGDQILCSLALFMLDNADQSITPIRLGGDEFAAIASGPDCGARLMNYALALQRDMKTIRNHEDGSSVTISVGICTDVASRLSASDLFTDADRALYAAKAAGRNCIRSSNDRWATAAIQRA